MRERQFPTLPGLRLAETPTVQRIIDQADGVDGIKQTLALMEKLKNDYKINPIVRGLALSLVAQLPQKDYDGEVEAVASYVKNRVRYVRDIAGVETLQTPVKTLEYGQGDCDDKSTLLAAMLESLGHRCRFRAVGFREGDLCHVYVETRMAGKWLAIDTTEPVAVGWEPPGIKETVYSDGAPYDPALGSFFSNAVKKLKHKVTHPLANPIAELKKDLREDAVTVTHLPVVSKVMNKIVKIPLISQICKVCQFIPVYGIIFKVIDYAISIYKAAQALNAQIEVAKAKKQTALANGQSIEAAQAQVDQMRLQYTAAVDEVGGAERIDNLVNTVVLSGVTVLGLAGTYVYRQSHVLRR